MGGGVSGKRVRVAEGHVDQRGHHRIHDTDASSLPHTAGGGRQEEKEEREFHSQAIVLSRRGRGEREYLQ